MISNSKILVNQFMKHSLGLIFFLVTSLIWCQINTLQNALQEFNKDKPTTSKIVALEKTILSSPNDSVKVEALYRLGKVFLRLEKYNKAYGCYNQGLAIATKLKSTQKMGTLKEALGNLQFKLGKYDKSKSLYLEALAYFTTAEDSAKIKGNLALIDIKQGNTDNAISALTQLSNFKNIDSITQAITLTSIGNLYLDNRSDPKTAIIYYKRSISFINKKQASNLLSSINQNIAESYFKLKQYKEALFYNKASEAFFEIENNNELRASLYLFYAKIYEDEGKFELALKNYKLYKEYQKIVDDSKNLIQIENEEINNQLKNYEIINKLKEQKIQILKTEKSLANLKIYLLILLIVIVALIIYVVLKKQKNRIAALYNRVVQSQDKLEYSENKTEKIILDISQNNDYINHFSTKVKDVLEDIKDEKIKRNLTSLLLDLQSTKLKNDAEYNTISSTFLYNLGKNHPTLTEEERKICGLIFLNYKNKEMATTLNLSLRSVENCRYRIRKKMDLETITSLQQYIQSLQ